MASYYGAAIDLIVKHADFLDPERVSWNRRLTEEARNAAKVARLGCYDVILGAVNEQVK